MSNIPTEDTIVKMDSVEEEEWIRAIKSLLFRNSEEGLIPEVTVSDNGKVLTVVKGAWDKADAPSGGSGEAGYECTETTEQLFSETVTTAESDDGYTAELAYSEPITADELTVVFNGTEYVCPKIVDDSIMFYGGFDLNEGRPDFTNYPFVIGGVGGMNSIATESPMTVTVSASVTSSTVETTECFERAVKSVVDAGYECSETRTSLFEETVTTVDYGGGIGADLAYSDPITADKLIVLLNGTEYVCPKINYGADGDVYYGGFNPSIGQPDYTDYPFYIWSSANNGSGLDTETANTYHIEVVTVVTEATDISPCFASAVRKASDSSVKITNATLSAHNVSVDGSETVIIPMPPDWASTLGVIHITPLETEDVYLSYFDCSGQNEQFTLHYISKQSSAVTIDEVGIIISYIPTSGDK